MRSILCFVSEGLVRDAQSNNISAFNILERYSSPAFPLFIPKIFFFALLERNNTEGSDFELRLQILNNGERLNEVTLTANFQTSLLNRQLVSIGGLAIPNPGRLIFNLSRDEELLGSYSIEIVRTGTPEIIPAQG